jgi:hypothetical protein
MHFRKSIYDSCITKSNSRLQPPTCIVDMARPLTVDEIRAELSLRFEGLKMKSARNED